MSNDPTTLEQTQDLILDYLRSVPALDGLGVQWISRKDGQLINDIDAGRAQLALACFVYPVAPVSCNPNTAGPVFDRLQIRVTWFENYELNHDANKHADETALITLQSLHHLSIKDQGVHMVTAQEESPMEWTLTKQGLQQWDCWFNCQLSLPHIPRTPRPTITYDAQTEEVAITCSDGDATIYYTTDGTFPYPENPDATLYSAPFTAAADTTIRAIARRSCFAPSNLISVTLSEIA